MFCLGASLFLSAILMTCANVIESDVTESEPLSEQLFIFDVISDAPLADVKGALDSASINARHSFQVIGAGRYLFVVVDDGSDALGQLTFPEGSVVTQYPAEHAEEFFKLAGASGWEEEDTSDALDNENLVVIEWEHVVPVGSSTADLLSAAKAFEEEYLGAHKLVGPVSYALLGKYPPKMFFFMNLDENSAQKAILDGFDAVGGPGNHVINFLRLRKI